MTLVSTSGASFLSAPRVSTPFFFLVTERMRLSLSFHPQLSVIAPTNTVCRSLRVIIQRRTSKKQLAIDNGYKKKVSDFMMLLLGS
jgi:hypothetical protein